MVIVARLWLGQATKGLEQPLKNPVYFSGNTQLVEGNSLVAPNIPSFVASNAVLADLMAGNDPDSYFGVLASINENNALYDVLYKLAQCESGFRKDKCIIDTNGKLSCGLFQFQKETWDTYCEGEWLNPQDQIKCAGEMISKGIGKQHWTNCFNKLKL